MSREAVLSSRKAEIFIWWSLISEIMESVLQLPTFRNITLGETPSPNSSDENPNPW